MLPPGISVPLLALVLAAAIYDIRYRRIPNWLNVAGVAVGFLLNAALLPRPDLGLIRPLDGVLFALKGFLIAFGLHFVFYLLRFTGAGDVKLMGAVGAMAGWPNWFGIFLLNAIIGGVLAVIFAMARGRLRKTLFNVGFALGELAHFRAPYLAKEELDVNSPKSMRLPRGAMVALGTIAFLGASWAATH